MARKLSAMSAGLFWGFGLQAIPLAAPALNRQVDGGKPALALVRISWPIMNRMAW